MGQIPLRNDTLFLFLVPQEELRDFFSLLYTGSYWWSGKILAPGPLYTLTLKQRGNEGRAVQGLTEVQSFT